MDAFVKKAVDLVLPGCCILSFPDHLSADRNVLQQQITLVVFDQEPETRGFIIPLLKDPFGL